MLDAAKSEIANVGECLVDVAGMVPEIGSEAEMLEQRTELLAILKDSGFSKIRTHFQPYGIWGIASDLESCEVKILESMVCSFVHPYCLAGNRFAIYYTASQHHPYHGRYMKAQN